MFADAARAVAHQFGRRHCVLVGSGTAALYCAFESLRRQRSSVKSPAILFPNITCETAVNAAVFAGLATKFCDVRREDALLCAQSARQVVTESDIVGVVPTHIFGHLLDIPALERELGVAVAIIEDAAQGYGGQLGTHMAGSMGAASVVSFGAGKLLECGGGGALLCDDDAHADGYREIAAALPVDDSGAATQRQYVMQKMMAARKSFNGNRAGLIQRQLDILREHRDGYLAQCPPGLAGAIQAGLSKLDSIVGQREELMRRLDDLLSRVNSVQLPARSGRPALWRYTFMLQADERDAKVEQMRSAGLAVSKLFSPCTYRFATAGPSLPNSERLAATVVNVHFPEGRTDQAQVVAAFERVFS